MLKVGSKAPEFALEDAKQQTHSLSQALGKTVILYFYPRDNTPGCTQQACDFRDQLESLNAQNTVIFGISRDSARSHANFQAKHDLNFTLLSDPELIAHQSYHALKEQDKTVRSTFLIDKTGKIIKIWPKVSVKGHVAEVLEAIEQLT